VYFVLLRGLTSIVKEETEAFLIQRREKGTLDKIKNKAK
jgi:hypothetical protein